MPQYSATLIRILEQMRLDSKIQLFYNEDRIKIAGQKINPAPFPAGGAYVQECKNCYWLYIDYGSAHWRRRILSDGKFRKNESG
jgi:hypothetical protein